MVEARTIAQSSILSVSQDALNVYAIVGFYVVTP